MGVVRERCRRRSHAGCRQVGAVAWVVEDDAHDEHPRSERAHGVFAVHVGSECARSMGSASRLCLRGLMNGVFCCAGSS